MTDWLYDSSVNPSDYAAYVYLITHTPTGRMYVGRKYLESRRKKQVKTKPGAKNKKKTQIVKTESDWRDYWGSSNVLKAHMAAHRIEQYTRRVLHWCKTRTEANFLEAKEMFARDVLTARLPDGTRAYFNEHILMKFHAPKN